MGALRGITNYLGVTIPQHEIDSAREDVDRAESRVDSYRTYNQGKAGKDKAERDLAEARRVFRNLSS